MKTRKILSVLLTPVMIVALTISCSNEDDAITTSVKDVSSRITGYSSEVTGAGAPLTITGTGLNRVQRIVFGQTVVPSKTFTEVTETSLTFPVPTSAPVGESRVFLVFPGSERAFAPPITVVPRPLISTVKPLSATTSETITILGADLNYVKGVTVGGVAATIASQSNTMIKFAMPASAATGIVTLASDAGNVSGTPTQAIVACSQDGSNELCKTNLLLNGGFEEGTGDNLTNWGKYNGAALLTATTVESEVFRGSRALKANVNGTQGGAEQYRVQLASDLVTTEIGATYTLSARIKASITGATIRFSTQPSALYQGNTAVGTDWTLVKWTFTANVASTRMVLDLGGAINVVHYIDDLRLIKN